MKLVVTGGAGFIGSAVCRFLIRETESHVVNVDKLTYAASPEAVDGLAASERYVHEKADICDADAMDRIFATHKPDAVMHLAAESHVDRSIEGPAAFIESNIVGTFKLLQATRRYLDGAGRGKSAAFRFHGVSTDEVYGSLGAEGAFTEETAYAPNSPYSASKAAADHLVRAWQHTFGLPTVLSNCSNNYGPYQHPEKLIPLMITNGLQGRPLPVYGAGANVRDWLFVEDHARALWLVLTRARVGEKYNIGGDAEMKNIELVQRVCSILDELVPPTSCRVRSELITYVTDRPGHDLRYAIDASKIRRELGWSPRETLVTGLRRTVEWYVANQNWCTAVRSRGYDNERLGLVQSKAAAVS